MSNVYLDRIFTVCTLVGLLYECRMELAYPDTGTNHV
jgi:hypothetical protein